VVARNCRQAGLICPYGHQGKAEWNHFQPVGLKSVPADNLLRQTITADGPVSLEAMFEAGRVMRGRTGLCERFPLRTKPSDLQVAQLGGHYAVYHKHRKIWPAS
jgi:hypothetical protein